MLDIGWSELLLLAVVAVIVIGPKDLPRFMRVIGRYTGRARSLAREFRSSFEELGRQAELEEINKEMEKIRREDPLSKRVNAIAPPSSEKSGQEVKEENKGEKASVASPRSDTQGNTAG